MVLIWCTKDFTQKEHKSSRVNIEFDFARHICWSPDSKAFIIYKAVGAAIEVHKVTKRADGTLGNAQLALSFPQLDDTADLLALGFDINGKFIMTCNSKNQLIIWDLKGEVLEQQELKHGDTYSAVLSPCGRFVATMGFTPDVKVWEVRFNKSGTFEGLKRAFELKGHKSGIYSCSFSCDSTKMVSCSKDGTWKLYDTKIEFDKGQEPYLLLSRDYDRGSSTMLPLICLSPDGRAVAVALISTITFYSAITGEKLNQIDNIYSGKIVKMMFDPSNKFLVTLGDKHIRIFHNVAGYIATIQDLEQSLPKATSIAMRERIEKQIQDAKDALVALRKITS